MQIRWILSCSTVLGLVKLTKIFQSKRFLKKQLCFYNNDDNDDNNNDNNNNNNNNNTNNGNFHSIYPNIYNTKLKPKSMALTRQQGALMTYSHR